MYVDDCTVALMTGDGNFGEIWLVKIIPGEDMSIPDMAN